MSLPERRSEPFADEAQRRHMRPPLRQAAVLGLIAIAMAVAVLPGFAIAVLADQILSDLHMSRADLGVVGAIVPAVAALSSIWLGGLADRRGGRATTVLSLSLGAASLAGTAVAPSFGVILAASLVAGLCQGGATSATNLVVLEAFGRARRGLIVGIKQSGEMAAIVAAGVAMPLAAATLGWRGAIAIAAVIPAVALVGTLLLLPARAKRDPAVPHESVVRAPLGRDVWWLTAYATIMGLSGGALSTYFPLYAQQSVGLSTVAAGQALALTGVVAIPGRIIWGQFSERSGRYTASLAILSLLAASGALLLWSASRIGPELLWVGALVWGASQLTWGSVAILAVLSFAGPGSAGRATGALLVGMSVGLTVGPVLFGVAVDATNSYDVGFAGVVAVLLTAAAIIASWRRPARQLLVASRQP